MSTSARVAAGVAFDWEALPQVRTALDDVPRSATELRLRREKASHRGIAEFTELRRLWAYSVDPAFFEEICSIPSLESLYVSGTTVTNLSGLSRIRTLRTLIVIGGTKVADLEWTNGLRSLSVLAIENFKRVEALDPLASLTGLRALGVEGSLWTPMRVASLDPLQRLTNLDCLFITNLRARDGSLRALHNLARLRELECGNLFARGELERLRRVLPHTNCSWFDMMAEHGSVAAGMKALMSRLRAPHGARRRER